VTQNSEDGPPPHSSGGLAGQLLDARYRIEVLLGHGGMSEVYRAHHLRMDRRCAVKVIHPARARDPDAGLRFEREARAISRIAHPNVCRVYDFGSTPGGLQYLSMEYLEGRTLAAELAGGPLPVERAARLAIQCAAGLQAAHEAGVVHRDLKPDNVMLVSRDGQEQAVLFDFGIALAATDAGVTRDGLMIGTPEVMSPEQLAGDPVDARSDQYQLALLLCRMATGVLPFEGATTQETMSQRLAGTPTPLLALRPGLNAPAGLQVVLTRALARRPDLRYPTMREFGAAIADALQGAADSPTVVLVRGGNGGSSPIPPTRVGLPGWLVGWGGRALAAGTVLVVALYLWLAPPDAGPAVTPPPAPSGTVPPPAPPPAPGGVRSAPPAAPPLALPGLPAVDSVYSALAPVRERARQMAESVYAHSSAADSVRAEAAFLVAATYLTERLTATARVWLVRCLNLQERAGCRRLLNELP